tara:strand:- start:3719 stop:3958 length:240 start_codon:yes stop_codon:yes gene_type:complete
MLAGIIGVEVVKQLFKFGGSFRKEAITVGTFVPAVVSVFNAQNAGGWGAVSGEQWAFLIGSTIALVVHLNAKRLENQKR